MCQSATMSYSCDTSAPRHARDFCAEFVAAAIPDGQAVLDLAEDTRLVVSELVTNAVNAGSPEVNVTVAVHRAYVRLAVDDYVPRRPQKRWAAPEDEHGRGLMIVASLSRAWGVDYVQRGKQVWAELPTANELTSSVLCYLDVDA